MLGSFGNHKFTDINNTAGVIHVVRDPRNVVSSLKSHFQLPNISAATYFMLHKNNWIFAKNNKNKGVLPSFISSWNNHYLSWKDFPKNYILIKYEDLLKKLNNKIIKIYNYLKKFYELNLNNEDLDKIIKLSSFENLKRKESEDGFDENFENKKTKKIVPFFNSGPSNEWEKQLDENERYKIEKEFNKEMKELGYL